MLPKENGTFLEIFGKTDCNYEGHVQYNLKVTGWRRLNFAIGFLRGGAPGLFCSL